MNTIIPVNLKSGMFSRKLNAMILTEEALVLIPISNEELKKAAEELMIYQKEQGIGLLGRLANANKHIIIACNKYESSTLEDIHRSGATIISYDDIKGAKIKNYSLMQNDNAQTTNEVPTLTIETRTSKIIAYFLGDWSFLENKENLKLALGEKLKY